MAEIILHGDCRVNRAGELHQLLRYHLNSAEERVEVDLSTTGRCDLSFFQLICAACRSFSRLHKRMVLRHALAPTIVSQFHKTGLSAACADCVFVECPLKSALFDNQEESISQ
ncbi:MAG: STAS domain-containing protein [Desulfosudaceae bacterium]